jgi:hypothetical protein
MATHQGAVHLGHSYGTISDRGRQGHVFGSMMHLGDRGDSIQFLDNLGASDYHVRIDTGIDAYDSFDYHCPIKRRGQIQGGLTNPATTFSFVYDPHKLNEPMVSDLPDSQTVQKWIDEIIENARDKPPEGVNSIHLLLINKRKWNEASSSFTDLQSFSLGLWKGLNQRPWHPMPLSFCRFPSPSTYLKNADEVAKQDGKWSYAIAYIYGWHIRWSFIHSSNTTVAILIWEGQKVGQEEDAFSIVPKNILGLLSVYGGSYANPMVVGSFVIRAMVGDLEHRVIDLGDRVGKCQKITGLHVYDDLPDVPYKDVSFKEEDLASLLGTASLLGRYTKVLRSLLEFAQLVKSENDRFLGLPGEGDVMLGRYISESTEFEMSRIKVLQGTVKEYHETASALIPGVLNILTHRDLEANTEVAKKLMDVVRESKEVAENSKKVAEKTQEAVEASQKIADAARRDGTSMSTIAFVTMFFLPGTFVAVGHILFVYLSFLKLTDSTVNVYYTILSRCYKYKGCFQLVLDLLGCHSTPHSLSASRMVSLGQVQREDSMNNDSEV